MSLDIPPPRKKGPFTLIGRRADVEVYHGELGRHIELAAAGELYVSVEEAHAALVLHVDHRVIATMAESWIAGVAPATILMPDGLLMPAANTRDFSLSQTTGGSVGLAFKILDDRGADTRGRNWVDQISGSWGFDRVHGGRAARAIYHVRIELASPLARWIVTSGALRDLPLIIEQLRALARPHQTHAAPATRRAS